MVTNRTARQHLQNRNGNKDVISSSSRRPRSSSQQSSGALFFADSRRRRPSAAIDVTDSDDPTKEVLSFTVDGYLFETTPGTALGTGERFNLPRPETSAFTIIPTNVLPGQVIEISEVRCGVLSLGLLVGRMQLIAAIHTWSIRENEANHTCLPLGACSSHRKRVHERGNACLDDGVSCLLNNKHYHGKARIGFGLGRVGLFKHRNKAPANITLVFYETEVRDGRVFAVTLT